MTITLFCKYMDTLQENKWHMQQATVEAMIPLIGKLYREQQIICSVFGRSLINRSVSNILQTHQYTKAEQGNKLDVKDTLAFIKILLELKLKAARIDVGRLLIAWQTQSAETSLAAFIKKQLTEVVGRQDLPKNTRDIVLYGFGRIGRLIARILAESSDHPNGTNLKAIVVRKQKNHDDLRKRAALLGRDSIHGAFKGIVEFNEDANQIIVNDNTVQIIYADHPDKVDYSRYGINNAILIDNTGAWRDIDGLKQHMTGSAISKVLLTAPGKGTIKNIVYGINHDSLTESDTIVSAASCTTNAITPVLKLINDNFIIVHGHIETVHAYTNDQNLIDNYHRSDRRGRAAALNMVITETGAAKAVTKILPELAGKLTSNAIRVPIPNVSLAILNLNLKKRVTMSDLNQFLYNRAFKSGLHRQITVSTCQDAVSSDFIGSRYAGIIDAKATKTCGNNCILYVWYDNEFGYSCQVNRVLQQMAGTLLKEYPAYKDHFV